MMRIERTNEADNATNNDDDSKPCAFEQEILYRKVGEEPTAGDIARVQIRLPDGKRLVRKFGGDCPVKVTYTFVAQSNEEELKAKFPPQDLFSSIDASISSCGLKMERQSMSFGINATPLWIVMFLCV